MTKKEFCKTLQEHRDWVNNRSGRRADFRGADLLGVDLRTATMEFATMAGANATKGFDEMVNGNAPKNANGQDLDKGVER